MAARSVLMIEPKNFVSNPQTAGDNFFQHMPAYVTDENIEEKALKEFNSLTKVLKHAGIEVQTFAQRDPVVTPDAVFPNNWFSTMPDGTLVLYPMMAGNRRLERRTPIIQYLSKHYPKLLDLTHDEDRGIFLEGTGSLVIDHLNKIAYASLSQRTSSNMVFEWSKLTGYDTVIFTSYDRNGQVIYHTNVMMCLGEKFAILCSEAIEDEDGRDRVTKSLVQTGHEIIDITFDQMHHFCGNCVELENNKKEKFLLMSSRAYDHFSVEQKNTIQKYCVILHSRLDTIETFGGGGARCMVAELF